MFAGAGNAASGFAATRIDHAGKRLAKVVLVLGHLFLPVW
jgi:hypothetical protein